MCTRSVRLDDAPYAKVLRHLHPCFFGPGLPQHLPALYLPRQLQSEGEVATFYALAVNDPSFRPNAVLEKSDEYGSSRLPALHRGDAHASRTHVLSDRPFLGHRFVWARKLCGQYLRDTPLGPTGWNVRG